MAVFFWYPLKLDFSSVNYCTVAYTNVNFYNVLEQYGHVYLVGLYINCYILYSILNKIKCRYIIFRTPVKRRSL